MKKPICLSCWPVLLWCLFNLMYEIIFIHSNKENE
jgi:hypothetical protein